MATKDEIIASTVNAASVPTKLVIDSTKEQSISQESSPPTQPLDNGKGSSKPVELADTTKKQSDPTSPDKKNTPKKPAASKLAPYRGLIIAIILLAIPIAELVIGVRHGNECPVNPRIPHYLVVAGVIGCIVVGFYIITTVLELALYAGAGGNKVGVLGLLVCCSWVCSFLIQLVLMGFLAIWNILGIVWVLRVWSKVQFEHPAFANYCYSTLYRFAFWRLWIGLPILLLACALFCYTIVKQILSDGKGKHVRAPTSAPRAEQASSAAKPV